MWRRRTSTIFFLAAAWVLALASGAWCDDGLLVLTTGRTIAGRISNGAGGYLVKRPKGSVLVPYDSVKFLAADLDDAYRQQQEARPDDSADAYVAVGQWCLTHRMYDEARDELAAALTREPGRDDVRATLMRLETMLNPLPPPETDDQDRVRRRETTGMEIESLGGLLPSTAEEFTTRIQPLLVNKCGNASCHGRAAENEFRLAHVRRGRATHRIHSERNLSLVMRFVNLAQPDLSLILTKPLGNHGAGGAVFHGNDGRLQYKSLHDWVHAVAAERRKESEPRASPKKSSAGFPLAVLRQGDERRPEKSRAEERIPPEDDDPLVKAVVPVRADAFDPAAFNRRFSAPSALHQHNGGP